MGNNIAQNHRLRAIHYAILELLSQPSRRGLIHRTSRTLSAGAATGSPTYAAADVQWRAHPKAFDTMFRYAIARQEPDELEGWVVLEDGSVPGIPPTHW
jgi:hypothetical protein